MKLGEIISLDALQKIQDCFTQATGFAAITVDYRGRPLLEYSNFSPFCSKVRENEFYNDKCYLSDAHGSLEAVRRGAVYTYRCHMGLVDFAIPIIVDGEYVASMMCGQVLVENPEDVTEKFVYSSISFIEQNPDIKELYERIPTVPFKKIKETANLMYLTLNYIVEQYLLNQKNLRLLQEQKEKIELEQMYRDMELRYYASQINPHFLFNALNIAGRQAYLENAEKTQEVIYALADMYRGYLISTDLLISVTEELRNVKNYIFIQRNRFGEQLKYEQNIPDEILKLKIPTMTLQIFIENSIRHGLEKKEDLGFVRLNASVLQKGQKQYALFEICDNGVGIPEDIYASLKSKKLDSFNLGSSRGIYSVYKKLVYYFQNDFDMEFYSDAREGARVKLTIPALK